LLETLGNDFGVEIRYLRNVLRVWFVPLFESKPVIKRPLAEEPIPKDKWLTPSDLMAFSTPPVDQVQDEVAILFGPECTLHERYPDPEVQGGKIALIALKRMRAQKPPNDLDRMQSVLQKQIAYNQRIMEAEDEIAGINCDLPRFLWEMKFTEEEQVIICVNGSESMKRNEEQIAGQLWIQGDRQMAASNKVLDGMANTRDSAVLSAVVEAVAWCHAGEPAGSRKGQRVIVYPKDIPQFDALLRGRDPNIDSTDGHPIAYQAILQHSDGYEKPPVFLSENSEPVVSDPAMAIRVPEWMAASRQIAVGNRQRTLEDGDDKMDSSDEDDPKMQPDILTGVYTAEMDPKQGPRKLSQAEAAYQRAVAQARREQMIQSVPRVDSPQPDETFVSSEPPPVSVRKSGGSSDDDTLDRPEWIWSETHGRQRKNKEWVTKLAQDALALPAPDPNSRPPQDPLALPAPENASVSRSKDTSAIRSRAVAESSALVPAVATSKRVSKVGASPRAPADQSKGAKAPPPTKGQQVPKPMETRSASRAGGLRGVVGSGSNGDTCVAQGNPSSKPGS
jgi:hypothetical protein